MPTPLRVHTIKAPSTGTTTVPAMSRAVVLGFFVVLAAESLWGQYEAFRTWTAPTREVLDEYPSQPLFSPEMATVLSISGDQIAGFFDNLANAKTPVRLASRFAETGSLGVYLWPQGQLAPGLRLTRPGEGPDLSAYAAFDHAPLIVLVAGLFSEMTFWEPYITKRMKFFHDHGYHVLVLPTVGGPNTIDDHVTVLPFHFRDEAQLELELIDRAVEALGADRVEAIHLAGMSYGATVAVAMTAVDAARAQPRIASMTGFAPIYDIETTLTFLDRGMEEQKALFEAEVRQDQLTPRARSWAKALVAYPGYQNQLQMYLRAVLRNRAFYASRLNLDFEPRLDNITYWEYVREVDPNLLAANNPAIAPGEQFYSHWVADADRLGPRKIRLLTTDDEMLNESPPWLDNPLYSFTLGQDFASLPWGGHGGYTYLTPWFHRLLAKAFPAWDVASQRYR